MKRRAVVVGLAFLIVSGVTASWPHETFAQQGSSPADRVYRLGFLTPGFADNPGARPKETISAELARFGFVEGKNLRIEARYGEGRPERLHLLAKEIADLGVDAIVAVLAAQQAAPSVPIVMAFAGQDPIAAGLAKSLPRPGGNVAGIALLSTEMEAKRVELLAKALPQSKRLAFLAQQHNDLRLAQGTAATLKIELLIIRADSKERYDEAFAEITRMAPSGLVIGSSPVFFRDGAELAARAAKMGMPTACEWREMAEQGCLLSFGPRVSNLHRRAAGYVARIFNGESAADLPIEQPTVFELVVNLKVARSLGASLPLSLQAQADEVIE